jgi:hypothetical protein
MESKFYCGLSLPTILIISKLKSTLNLQTNNQCEEKKQFSSILDSPNNLFEDVPLETLREINEKENEIPTFSDLHSSFKTEIDFESWKGFRLSFFYHPSHIFNFESQICCDKQKGFSNNYFLNAFTSIYGKILGEIVKRQEEFRSKYRNHCSFRRRNQKDLPT